jgi:hypothetical protein
MEDGVSDAKKKSHHKAHSGRKADRKKLKDSKAGPGAYPVSY